MKNYLLPCLLFAALAAPAFAQDDALVAPEPRPSVTVKVKLEDAQGREAGAASITETQKGLLVRIEAAGLPPGWHAVHFHATGDCSDHADHFRKSGGHLLRAGESHGFLAAGGPHAGDLPNIWIGADGAGKAEFHTSRADLALLKNGDGAALMIHGGADDYSSQPAGDAGDRLACGVIAPGK